MGIALSITQMQKITESLAKGLALLMGVKKNPFPKVCVDHIMTNNIIKSNQENQGQYKAFAQLHFVENLDIQKNYARVIIRDFSEMVQLT